MIKLERKVVDNKPGLFWRGEELLRQVAEKRDIVSDL